MTQNFEVSLEIYNTEKLLQAMEDFSEVAEIWLQNNILHVSWVSQDEIQEVFYEFMNYVLSL